MSEVDSIREDSTAAGVRPSGLSTVEMVVTMGILVVLVGISIPLLNGARRSHAQAGCASNLHDIRTAFEYYTQAYQGYYPSPTPTAQWEELLREYVPRSTFSCPADSEFFVALGSSYDWRDTGNPETTLVGRPAMAVKRSDVSLAFDALPGWHAPSKVQVLKVGGSIELMSERDFFLELQRSPSKP